MSCSPRFYASTVPCEPASGSGRTGCRFVASRKTDSGRTRTGRPVSLLAGGPARGEPEDANRRRVRCEARGPDRAYSSALATGPGARGASVGRDLEAGHLVAQGVAVDAEGFGGSTQAAAMAAQRRHQELALELVAGLDERHPVRHQLFDDRRQPRGQIRPAQASRSRLTARARHSASAKPALTRVPQDRGYRARPASRTKASWIEGRILAQAASPPEARAISARAIAARATSDRARRRRRSDIATRSLSRPHSSGAPRGSRPRRSPPVDDDHRSGGRR